MHINLFSYAVMVALLARTLHTDAVTALSIMGLVNLGLFFLGLRLLFFQWYLNTEAQQPSMLCYSLFFCWGYDPWDWSGFFHIGILGYILPYPSTFSAALTLTRQLE